MREFKIDWQPFNRARPVQIAPTLADWQNLL